MRGSTVALLLLLLAAGAFGQNIGSEACGVCHEDLAKAFLQTRHRTLKEKSCESCHGPGAKHAESADIAAIVNPAKLKIDAGNRGCQQCHAAQAGHVKQQVSCGQCHTVHPKPGGQALIERRKPQLNAQCAACHASERAAFQRPHTHPVAQGGMSCTDCHNPHDAARRESKCVNCHANLRGPFVFEHAPVRMEGCGSCHEPHGTINPKMLTRAEVRTVCLECHANTSTAFGAVPPAFHDLRSPRIQACSTCHRKIHGSYVDRSLQR